MSSAGALHRPFVSFRVTILRDTQYTLYRIKWHGTVSYRPNIFCFFLFFRFFSFPGVSTLPYGTAHTALRGHAMSSNVSTLLSFFAPLYVHTIFYFERYSLCNVYASFNLNLKKMQAIQMRASV